MAVTNYNGSLADALIFAGKPTIDGSSTPDSTQAGIYWDVATTKIQAKLEACGFSVGSLTVTADSRADQLLKAVEAMWTSALVLQMMPTRSGKTAEQVQRLQEQGAECLDLFCSLGSRAGSDFGVTAGAPSVQAPTGLHTESLYENTSTIPEIPNPFPKSTNPEDYH